MSTTRNVVILKCIQGSYKRFNDILHKTPISPKTREILVYFGGDVQDIQEDMEKHSDSKKYIEWSLENTASILSSNFPNKHVLVIRPASMFKTRYAMFSCFTNFVPGNKYGVPSFCPTHNALEHLQKLIQSALEVYTRANDDKSLSNIKDIKLTLMGFSKGCVVMNQLLHEFHYYKANPDDDINNFVKLIESMWWLDGGHGGSKDTWITEKHILESFSKLGIHVNVHVTPYQIQDSHRPWIGTEEKSFCNTLQSLGVPLKRCVHFSDKPRNLQSHFNVLRVIKD